ncbi:MAG TPA: deoxyribonuclease IV [Candidatus Kapabacteria bacterium]|nr:deoxyribonuclease IV [Candidatus Kapabacteria bacterium]
MLGAHTSIAGGIHRAISRSRVFNGTALQIFSKNNNRWSAPDFTPEQLAEWHAAAKDFPLSAIAIHDSYLINLCSPNDETFARSLDAFVDEHRRAGQLGIRLLNFHPGAACGQPAGQALDLVARQINRAHSATPDSNTISVIETTAGQGSTLGWRFEEIAAIIRQIDDRSRIGVCLDTCHVFAAGYDISTEAGYTETMEQFEEIIGLNHLVLFHLNDSKTTLGSRVDRHEHIGRGRIGETAFRMLMADRRFISVPKVIETPKGPDLREDIENITLLRSFIPKDMQTADV